MVKLIMGLKGSGKTKRLVELVREDGQQVLDFGGSQLAHFTTLLLV